MSHQSLITIIYAGSSRAKSSRNLLTSRLTMTGTIGWSHVCSKSFTGSNHNVVLPRFRARQRRPVSLRDYSSSSDESD